jgi:hypothetical protein
MYENRKMRPRIGGGGIKENEGGVNFMKIYYKCFCKCYNVPPVQQ